VNLAELRQTDGEEKEIYSYGIRDLFLLVRNLGPGARASNCAETHLELRSHCDLLGRKITNIWESPGYQHHMYLFPEYGDILLNVGYGVHAACNNVVFVPLWDWKAWLGPQGPAAIPVRPLPRLKL
jgi:hypothetical protein